MLENPLITHPEVAEIFKGKNLILFPENATIHCSSLGITWPEDEHTPLVQ